MTVGTLSPKEYRDFAAEVCVAEVKREPAAYL
jgi:hypothetical protein